MRPPENSPRATSYVLVTICVERTASCGTEPEPKLSPSSVTELAVGRRPATENWVSVESVASMPTTPGANVARAFRSLASIGRRAAISDEMSRSVEPGVRWLPRPLLRRAWTLTVARRWAVGDICTSPTRRSSSAWRATATTDGAIPMNRMVSRYCPPPSGKTIVYRPLSFVWACRVISVSIDIASTSAPSMGWPRGSVTVPVRMSVVVPTCATLDLGVATSDTATRVAAIDATRRQERRWVHPGWRVITMG